MADVQTTIRTPLVKDLVLDDKEKVKEARKRFMRNRFRNVAWAVMARGAQKAKVKRA